MPPLHGDGRGGDPDNLLGTTACGRPWHQGAGSTVCRLSGSLGSQAGPRHGQGSQEPRLDCKHARMKLQPLMFLEKLCVERAPGPLS